jgi:hypothetical protein
MKTHKLFNRRFVLRGLGGVAVGLPLLDIFEPRGARAQAVAKPVYSALMLQQNGAIQGNGDDEDLFWPKDLGAFDKAILAAQTSQTISELADFADKIACVKGMDFRYSNNHDGGPIAASCACPVEGEGTDQLPTAESVDVFIANSLMAPEPLTLYAGRKGTFRDDAFSFNKGGVLRIGDNNPWNVYKRLIGLQGTDPETVDKIAQRRLSVNDLIRSDLKQLLSRTDLSKEDRERLDLHFTSVRELEMNTTMVSGPELDEAALKPFETKNAATDNGNFETVVRLQLDLIAFAFASNRVRTASLQVGGCNDHTKYMINGVEAPPYHFISHRIMSDGDDGAAIDNAVELHHQIDRIHARFFKHLLERLSAYTMPGGGTLLDSSVNLWVNSVADGPPHSGKNIPHVFGGGANGFLKMGQSIEMQGYTNQALNTIASACGVRKADGGLVDDFGDPDSQGLIQGMIAT